MKGPVIAALLLIAAVPSVVVGADGVPGSGEQQLATIIAQAGAIGVLSVVLFFYRRDFMRKVEQERAANEQLADLLEKSNECIRNSSVAMARQTDATHRLARTVEHLERAIDRRPHSGA